MKEIHKIEALVASWYKDIPHLPESGRKWLADNIWWLALIGVILGVFGIFAVLGAVLLASAALVAVGGAYGAAIGVVAFIALLVYLAVALVELVLTGLAIMPLKAGQQKGWTLLFMVALVNVISLVVSFISNLDLLALVGGVLMAAVGTYFLFEIRGYFIKVGAAKPLKETPKKIV